MNDGFGAALRRLVRGQLTLADLWLLLPLLLLFIMLNLYQIQPYDFWWHLRTGQIIFETRAIPTVDLFSFTAAGQPWTNQAWLAQLTMYLLYRVGNLPFIILANAVAIVAGYLLVEVASLRNSGGQARAAALATAAAAALSFLNWNVRPQTASLALFGAVVAILETHRLRGGRVVWGLPLVFAAWGNLHGAFAFGGLLVGIYVLVRAAEDLAGARRLSQETRRLFGASTAALVTLALNPGGPLGMIRYVFNLSGSKIIQESVAEWMPLSVRTLDGQVFLGVVILFLGVLYLRRAVLPSCQFAALLTFGCLALYTRRAEPWFGMVLAPPFAGILAGPAVQGARPASSTALARLNGLILGALLALALTSLPWLRPYLPLPAPSRSYITTDDTPVQAVEMLCRLGPTIHLFNDMGDGSYVSWACPRLRVFIDTRIEQYSDALWQEYFLASAGQFGWDTILTRYQINVLLLQHDRQKLLIAAVQASGAWRVMYEDGYTVLLVRTNPQEGM